MFMGFGISTSLLWISFTSLRNVLLRWCEVIRAKLPRQVVLNVIIFALSLVILIFSCFSRWSATIDHFLPAWWLIGHLALFGSVFLYAARRKQSLLMCLIGTALAYGVVYQVIFYTHYINTFPLTMGWSEASRYYNASLFFSKKIYGISLPLPILHPSRYMMQAVPFLVSGLPLWFHRLWQVLLWLGFTWAGSASLVRRLRPDSRWLGLLLTALGFLFFFQGPVYYHLFLAAIIVLLGFNSRHPWRSTVVVLLASIWAGLSRINWFPVPGLLAVFLYVLETPLVGNSWWRYWIMPAIWAAGGLLAAYLTQEVYIVISHNPPEVFGSSLNSPLLWYRLWPNTTFSMGIIPGLAWAIFPMIAILLSCFIPRVKAWHPLRSLALFAILAVFLVGGIVVSVKIGGGSNLHNLDAFLVLMATVTGYTYLGRYIPDWLENKRPAKVAWVWLALAIMIPIIAVINPKADVYQLSPAYDKQLSSLQSLLDQSSQQGGKPLFITQRYLVTFGMLQHVVMAPDYERIFLMEMAMADNQAYLKVFENDLATHRYAYIIFEPLTGGLQTTENAFSEENNAWYTHVTMTLLKYYQLKVNYPALDIAVLEPCEPVGCGVIH